MKESEILNVWKVNHPLDRELGYGSTVWFYLEPGDVDRLASERPENYLEVMSDWTHLLFNQEYYEVKDAAVKVVCSNLIDGEIRRATFECLALPGGLRIMSVGTYEGPGDWKSFKKMRRK